MTAPMPGTKAAASARMAALQQQAETDHVTLLEYARLWMQYLYSGSPQFRKPKEPGTGPWVTRLLIEALASRLPTPDQAKATADAAATLRALADYIEASRTWERTRHGTPEAHEAQQEMWRLHKTLTDMGPVVPRAQAEALEGR